jgi:hypothetical protein
MRKAKGASSRIKIQFIEFLCERWMRLDRELGFWLKAVRADSYGSLVPRPGG